MKERIGHRGSDSRHAHRQARLMRKAIQAQKVADRVRDRRRRHMEIETNSLSSEDDESDRPSGASVIVDPNNV